MEYIYDNMAIHRYDYGLLDQIDPSNHTDDVIRWVVKEMNNATANARNLRDIDESVPKYKKWKERAYKYYDPTTTKVKNWGLVCAAYGYAVEEYVNIKVRGGGYPYASEFEVLVQDPDGRTIPDVKIRRYYTDSSTGETKKTEVAWLDITSEKSVCHIYDKNSNGWRSKPIVIEMVYPPLDLSGFTF